MTEKKILKNRTIFLLASFVVLTVLLLGQLIGPSLAKYIKTEKDKVVAYYTALYLDSDGEGKTVSLENNQGFLNFQLMNFEDDNVTKRDITYEIYTPQIFYNENGEQLNPSDYINKETPVDLYIKDVWGTPKLVGKDTYKYAQDVIATNAEKINGLDAFIYEALGSSAVGKTHNITIELNRYPYINGVKLNGIESEEKVSIVVHLIQPYEEVFIINVTTSDKLIVFSNSSVELFETPFERVFVQTANIFSYYKGTENLREYTDKNDNTKKYKMTSRAFKVSFYWENLMINETDLDRLHIGLGNNPDPLDITKPYIISVDTVNNVLVMYVPEGSNFHLDFLIEDSSKACAVKTLVEAYVYEGKVENSQTTYSTAILTVKYTYDTFYGYEYGTENKYTIFSK